MTIEESGIYIEDFVFQIDSRCWQIYGVRNTNILYLFPMDQADGWNAAIWESEPFDNLLEMTDFSLEIRQHMEEFLDRIEFENRIMEHLL